MELTNFVKRCLIADGINALTNGELVEFVLAGDLFRAAHFQCKGAAGLHFFDFFFPAHLFPQQIRV